MRLVPLVALVLTAIAVDGRQSVPPPDLLLHNGKIVTVDRAFSVVQAVAITGDRIVATGSNEAVAKLAGPSTRRIDLGGRTVIPGLADNHLHGAGGGPGVDLSRTRSIADVLAAIAAQVKESQPGDVITSNSDWHEGQLAEQRLPLRRDIDRVAPDHPVVLVRGGHEYILNTAALRTWGIDQKTPVPEGGRISRNEDGSLNGELVDTAKALVTLPRQPERTVEQRIADRVAEYRTLNAAGLTSVRHPGVSVADYRLLQEMKARGLLTMRVNVLFRPGAGGDAIDALTSSGIRPDAGDEWLRVGGVKLGVDGGFEGGWMREPYAEPYGEGGTFRGLQTMSRDVYIATVRSLNRLGWRVATHAVGDRAIDLVLDGYETANRDKPIAGRRWTIEHGFIPRADQFPRMKALDLVISAQNHLYLAGPSLVRYWGKERAAWTTPMRAYLEQGLVASTGTDAPVVPYPPLWAIYHFVTRETISGGVEGADQAITREQALRASTINNAYLTFEEASKGSIEPGKLADLVVLEDDILTCPPKRIETMKILVTIAGGKVVYSDTSSFGIGDWGSRN